MALRNTLTHRKTRRLATRLKIEIPHALGLCEALFDVTARMTPHGDIGKLDNHEIAEEMFYTLDADELVAALVAAGWIDEDPLHRLIVHDWHDHSDDTTDIKVARSGLDYASGVTPRMRKLNASQRDALMVFRDEKKDERERLQQQRGDATRPSVAQRCATIANVAHTSTSTRASTSPLPGAGEALSSKHEIDQPENPATAQSGSDDSTKPPVSSITLAPRIDADEKARADERGGLQPSSTSTVSAKSPIKTGINTETHAREVAQPRAILRNGAQRCATRTEGEDDADPHDPAMVARGVMDTLKIAGRWTLVALEKVCKLELDSDPLLTSTGLHDSMVKSYTQWQHERPDIFANWKTEDFFGDGHWRAPENWPRRNIVANGKPQEKHEPGELMKRVREIHGPQKTKGENNGRRTSDGEVSPPDKARRENRHTGGAAR